MLFLTQYVAIPPTVDWWPMEHTWSLCSEEQFYLLWPALLVWALQSAEPAKSVKRAATIALAGIILIPTARVFFAFYPYTPYRFLTSTLLTLDVILFGVLAAVAEGHDLFERFYRWGTRSPLLLATLLFPVSNALEMRFPGRYIYSIGLTIDGVLITLLLLWTIREPQTIVGRILNWKPLAQIGVLSYSLYVWQTLFLHPRNGSVFGLDNHLPLPLGLLGIAICGAGSFFLVERPVLLLRDRIMRRKSPV